MSIDVIVPKLNNNDESCILNRWLADDGARVEPGTPIALLETSKATSELAAEHAGILVRLVDAQSECPFGSKIAHLFASEAERAAWKVERAATPAGAELVITKGAQELIERHGIPRERLQALGKSILRAADIEALVAPSQAKPPHKAMSAHQAAVARTVSASHATIPAAFLAVRVWTDRAVAACKALSAKHDSLIGMAELLVKIVGGLGEEFPIFYGVDQPAAVLAAPNVGVTFDAGSGLFIPVTRAPGKLALTAIADILMDYRLKTVRGSFKHEDLVDGHVSISLNTEDDVLFSIPIIQPGQTCMLSLGAITAVGADPTGPTAMTLGLAYDHRFINGYDAMEYIKAIKARIESAALTDA
jgi:2-oxoglutarate dehydrogenase E2 component (dihydrolipoamide succinyltransferase)